MDSSYRANSEEPHSGSSGQPFAAVAEFSSAAASSAVAAGYCLDQTFSAAVGEKRLTQPKSVSIHVKTTAFMGDTLDNRSWYKSMDLLNIWLHHGNVRVTAKRLPLLSLDVSLVPVLNGFQWYKSVLQV